MFLAEFLGVTSFPVGYIGLAGLGIVDDMSSQDGDLRYAFLRRLDLRRQLVVVGAGRRCFFRQFRLLKQIVLGQKIHGLGHLLQVKHLRPAGVPSAFPGL